MGKKQCELEEIIDAIKKCNYVWNEDFLIFIDTQLQIKKEPNILLQRLWEQFCLFSYQ